MDLEEYLQKSIKVLQAENLYEFLKNTRLDVSQRNIIYDYMNNDQRKKVKEYLDFVALSQPDKAKIKGLVDDWPKDIYLSKEVDEEQKKFLDGVERHEDGTFTMIPERPEPEKIDMEEYLKEQVKVLNQGGNVLEILKSLPITKSSKKIMIGFLEKKKPEKITSFCEYLGLSDEDIKRVDESVKNFIEVGGLRGMHIA